MRFNGTKAPQLLHFLPHFLYPIPQFPFSYIFPADRFGGRVARRDEADQGRESDEIVKHVGKQALVRRHGCASQLSDKDSIRAIREAFCVYSVFY